MDEDDFFTRRPEAPLSMLAKEDLDPLSLHELDARVAALKAEIARVEAHRDDAARHRSAADELFKR